MPNLDEKFAAYHKQNPRVFLLFKLYARESKNTGKKLGAKAIFEKIRVEEKKLHTKDPDGWHLNNIFTSRYARMLVEKHPYFKGYFNFRKLHPDKQDVKSVPEYNTRFPWRELKVGETFFVPGIKKTKISSAMGMAMNRTGLVFESENSDGGVIVRRVR